MTPQKKSSDRVQTLRNERATLTQDQAEAMRRATYVGMTADEAKAFEARRARLEALSSQLADLEKDQKR